MKEIREAFLNTYRFELYSDDELLAFARNKLSEIQDGDDEIFITAHEDYFHLLNFFNAETGEVRVFNRIISSNEIYLIKEPITADELWEILIESDPNAPVDPKHYTATFLKPRTPYLEWRLGSDRHVEMRFAFYGGKATKPLEWKKLKSAELYHQRKFNGPIWKWLSSVGYELSPETISKWDNFVPGEEELLCTTTGPSLMLSGEWEIPEKGWCMITRFEEIPSSTDIVSESKIERELNTMDEYLYYGYVIEPNDNSG